MKRKRDFISTSTSACTSITDNNNNNNNHNITFKYDHHTNKQYPIQTCTTIEEASNSILHRSFAIFQLNDPTYDSCIRSWKVARDFFTNRASDGRVLNADGRREYERDWVREEGMVREYRRVDGGRLMGFNRPSDVKLLFRAHCSYNYNEDGSDVNENYKENRVGRQPWPSEEMKSSSIAMVEKLHDILVDCIDCIRKKAHEIDEVEGLGESRTESLLPSSGDGAAFGHEQNVISHHQRRQDDDSTYVSKLYKNSPHPNSNSKTTKNSAVPQSYKDADASPLDYFFYHHTDHTPVVNCSEHVDRGVLICIVLTDVPGLEILPADRGESFGFVCPEEDIVAEKHFPTKDDDGGRPGCSNLICILSGDRLKDVVCRSNIKCDAGGSSSTSKSEHLVESHIGLNACVHRVKTRLCRPRLSMTYEIRCDDRNDEQLK